EEALVPRLDDVAAPYCLGGLVLRFAQAQERLGEGVLEGGQIGALLAVQFPSQRHPPSLDGGYLLLVVIQLLTESSQLPGIQLGSLDLDTVGEARPGELVGELLDRALELLGVGRQPPAETRLGGGGLRLSDGGVSNRLTGRRETPFQLFRLPAALGQ